MTSSKYRIGVLSPDLPPEPYGGMGRHVGVLNRALTSLGVQTIFMQPMLVRPPFGAMLYAFQTLFSLSRFCHREGIDILHVQSGPGGAFVLRAPPCPLIVTANHTYAAQSRLPGQRWKALFIPLERATLKRAAIIVCLSEDTADSVIRDYDIPRERVSVIPCGIDVPLWERADMDTREPRTCIFVGRRDTRKGWDLLKDAWPRVRARVPDAELHVIGIRGTDRDGITFLGRVPDDELQRRMGQARLLIAPSRLEGFGLAAAESIAVGTPVVACDVPGLRRVVSDGITGILVPPDPESITSAVSSVLTDDALFSRLRQGCKAARHALNAEEEARAYLRVYDLVYSSPRCL